jgi:hypothetical protein
VAYQLKRLYAIRNMTSFLMDDTGSMVLTIKSQIAAELEAAKKLGLPEEGVRTGINASGFYIKTPAGVIILYYTGRHHAAEILRRLLEHRLPGSPKVNKTTDGASKNFLGKDFEDILEDSICLVHGLLKFYDAKAQFPAEYAIVGSAYDKIYETEQIAKERGMSDEQRLAFHQERSASEMQKIKDMCDQKITSRLIDPRSKLWEAVHFFINQWPLLTKFLRISGIQLDTNLCEQSLIAPVRYLAASFNYHTEAGAKVGDEAMSLVATARANGTEPIPWLTHCLEHHDDLATKPENYFPWAYRDRIASQPQENKPPDTIH